MPTPRSSPARLAVATLVAAMTAACAIGACSSGPTVANFPDRSGVVAAQAEWCDGLAKVLGGGRPWDHLSACKAGYPTASVSYLHLMTKCFIRRLEAAGDQKPDRSGIVSECNDEIFPNFKESEAVAKDVIEARCARMNRCEHIPPDECKATFTKLDAVQRAQLTTIFNAAGRYEISDCLDTASCTDNEEAGRDACYKPVTEKLLWFPP